MNDPLNIDAALNEMESDLDLLAFCYITDDLSPAAKEAFELRLANEQSLREALARTVELSAALQSASHVELNHAVAVHPQSGHAEVQPKAFDRWMRVTSILAIASAACLAVMIGIRAIPRANKLSPETALVWSQVQDAWSDAGLAEESESAVTLVEASLAGGEREVEPSAEEQGEEELNSELPDWLLMAVDGSDDSEVQSTE